MHFMSINSSPRAYYIPLLLNQYYHQGLRVLVRAGKVGIPGWSDALTTERMFKELEVYID